MRHVFARHLANVKSCFLVFCILCIVFDDSDKQVTGWPNRHYDEWICGCLVGMFNGYLYNSEVSRIVQWIVDNLVAARITHWFVK